MALILAMARSALGLPEDVDQPIHITADNAEIDQTNGIIYYRGNVHLNQGTLAVNANTMTLEVKDEKVVKITAKGSAEHGPARYEQKLKQDESKVLADAEEIVYHTKEDFVELKGNAHLFQNDNKFSGDMIKYDIAAGRVKASSTKSSGVEMILNKRQ